MKQHASFLVAVVLLAAGLKSEAKSLDIYFIDVEGGQSTLIVTPQKEAFLIDTGFPDDGSFQSKAGDPAKARDANRILAAARDAGVNRIDYLLITHFHGDHVGGVVELSKLLPIRTFIDHGNVPAEAENGVPGTLDVFNAYAAIRATGKHIEPKPGDRLPLKGAKAIVVSSAGVTLAKSLSGAGKRNDGCGPSGRAAQDKIENPRSTGVRIEFGKFKFLDVGDLSGAPLFALACPTNLVGPVDVYLVAHHGGADAAEPATFAAFKPLVSVVNNGATKGGATELLNFLKQSPDAGATWQLHRSTNAGATNVSDEQIANLDESTAHWLKITAKDDGSFRVLNSRTGAWTDYGARAK